MIDKNILKLHFSKSAKSYDEYSNVQKVMADKISMKIPAGNFKNVLEIGCGTGYLTNILFNKYSKITAIDIANGMIEFTKNKFKDREISFICMDIESDTIESKYDLIISNATFQWFNDFSSTINKLYNLLNKDGVLAFATFGDKTFFELHNSYKKACENYNISNNLMPGQNFINKNVFINTEFDEYIVEVKQELYCEHFDSVKDFLKSVKKIGANNSNTKRNNDIKITKKMIEYYEKDYTKNGKVQATYDCLYFVLKKK